MGGWEEAGGHSITDGASPPPCTPTSHSGDQHSRGHRHHRWPGHLCPGSTTQRTYSERTVTWGWRRRTRTWHWALPGRHPPAGRLRVGAGAGAAGSGRALCGITKEARFALLTLGTFGVVLAVLGVNTGINSTVPQPSCCPPHPRPHQAVPVDLVTGAGVAMAAAAGACPQVGALRHPLEVGSTPLARQPHVAHRAPEDTAV